MDYHLWLNSKFLQRLQSNFFQWTKILNVHFLSLLILLNTSSIREVSHYFGWFDLLLEVILKNKKVASRSSDFFFFVKIWKRYILNDFVSFCKVFKTKAFFEFGNRVTLRDGRSGVVKYSWKGVVGILLDEMYDGDSDGTFEGIDHFVCDRNRATFVPTSEIIESEDPFEVNKFCQLKKISNNPSLK